MIDQAFPPGQRPQWPPAPEAFEPADALVPGEIAPGAFIPSEVAPGSSVLPQPQPVERAPVATEHVWKAGDFAYAEWGGQWDEVRILEVHNNGNVKIRWASWGPHWDQLVLGSTLRVQPANSGTRPFSARGNSDDSPGTEIGANTPLRVGDRVYVRSFGQWSAGTVTGIRTPQTVMVRIDDSPSPSSRDRPVPRRMLRLAVEPARPRATPQPSVPTVSRARTWTDASGKFKVQARFVELRGDVVVLEKDDGATVEIALDRLSPPDQQYARSQSAAQ
jgi:hypothetical protein